MALTDMKRLEHILFVKNHSSLPFDRNFGVIERALKITTGFTV